MMSALTIHKCILHPPARQNPRARDAGFTLLEVVISVGIFATLAVSAIGIMLGVARIRQKTAHLQAVIDNVRFSMELITKELRTGEEYASPGICSGAPGEELTFISNNTGIRERRAYYLNAGKIMKISLSGTDADRQITPADCAESPGGIAFPFTSNDVRINSLSFIVHGEILGQSDGQPRVTISMEAESRDPRMGADTHMNLQTTITQRIRDIQ